MISFPPCKINLGLQIIKKRADGYHDLITCFYPVPWCDMLEIIPATVFSFTSTGIRVPGNAQSNLCVRAYQLLNEDFHLPPVKIHLHKIIPMGAGLGGGSSDGAWTLRLLNEIFDLKLSIGSLAVYAARLGSDCTFFLYDQPMIGKGRGEILEPVRLDLSGKFIVLIKPDIHVSTAEAFAHIAPALPDIDLRSTLENHPPGEWKSLIKNDFEPSVFKKYNVIADLKLRLYEQGALYASMSGSGSVVFGIFTHQRDLAKLFSDHDYRCFTL